MNIHFTKRFLVPALLAFVAVPLLGSAHAQQVANGSFELDVASSTAPNPGTGWTASTSPVSVYIYNNSFAHGSTPYGSQWAFLQTESNALSQTIVGGFVVGQTYELHFSAGDLYNGTLPDIYARVTGAANTDNTRFTLIRSSSYFTNSPMSFVPCVLSFVPTTTGPITISIGSPSYPVALDNVYLVPEPSTWILLGFGALGVERIVLRPRQRRVSA